MLGRKKHFQGRRAKPRFLNLTYSLDTGKTKSLRISYLKSIVFLALVACCIFYASWQVVSYNIKGAVVIYSYAESFVKKYREVRQQGVLPIYATLPVPIIEPETKLVEKMMSLEALEKDDEENDQFLFDSDWVVDLESQYGHLAKPKAFEAAVKEKTTGGGSKNQHFLVRDLRISKQDKTTFFVEFVQVNKSEHRLQGQIWLEYLETSRASGQETKMTRSLEANMQKFSIQFLKKRTFTLAVSPEADIAQIAVYYRIDGDLSQNYFFQIYQKVTNPENSIDLGSLGMSDSDLTR